MSTDETAAEPSKGIACPHCGAWHRFDVYVYAHWDLRLQLTCECGGLCLIQRGEVISLHPTKQTA